MDGDLTVQCDPPRGEVERVSSPLASSGRILLVLQSADPPTAPGGMEAHCLDLAAELIRRGLCVAAIVPETETFDTLAARLQSAGATVTRLNTDARHGRGQQLRRWLRMARQIRRWRPDVVHLHVGGATGGLEVVATARLLSRARIVVTEHDVPDAQPRPSQRINRRAMDRLSHVLVAVSRRNAALRRERLGARPQTFAAVLNGVPIPQLTPETRAANRRRVRSALGIEPDAVVIGSLVRLAEGKGLDDLLRAFAFALQEQPCALLLVGDGPLRPDLEALARDLGIAGQVHFAGHRSEPAPYLDAMDIFALAVPAGSMSIALLEAMARGLPPVITFCGPEEAVIPEETGLCAPPHDPAGLASSLSRLVENGALRSRLGVAAAGHVRRHLSVERVASDLLEIYGIASCRGIPAHLRADAPPNPRPAG